MGQRLHLLLAAALGPVLAGLLAAGCGGVSRGNGVASKGPGQIVAAAKAAADGAATVHVSGSIASGSSPISLDMQLVAGKGGKGRIVQGGLDFRLIQVGRFVYVNGGPAFYRHVGGEQAAKELTGKWLKAPASGNFASLASLTNLDKLVDTTLTSHGKLASKGTTTVDGQQALAIEDIAKGGTLYVAATGSPYPLEVVKHGNSGGRVVFDKWNEPVSLEAPANAINIHQLQLRR